MWLALAAEAAAEAGHEAAGGASRFPPFDTSLFPHQLTWFALTFGAMYFIMAKIALPRVAAVLAAREAATKSDLDAAAEASARADEAKKSADAETAAARAKARELIDTMRAEAAAEFAAEQAKVDASLAKRTAEAEARIAGTRAAAMAEIAPLSADLAKDIAARVTGGAVGSVAA